MYHGSWRMTRPPPRGGLTTPIAIANKYFFVTVHCHGRLPVPAARLVTAFACDRTHTVAPPPVAAGAAPARPGAHSSRRCLRPPSHSVTLVSAAACGGLSFEAVVLSCPCRVRVHGSARTISPVTAALPSSST